MQFFQKKDKLECPSCGKKAKSVSSRTLNALLLQKAKSTLEYLDGFYYCKTPTCKTIYFRGQTLLTQEDMSIVVGLKEGAVPATLCYCFKWTEEKITNELIKTKKTEALEDIKVKMKNPGCACEVLNPSGRCCLSDTAKAIKKIKLELEI